MNSTRGRSLSLIVAGSITLTAGCAQHRVATSFGELEPRLKRGQTIYVTTARGETHKGKLEALSAGHVRITIAGSTVQVPAIFSLPQTSGSSVVISPVVGKGTAGIRLTAVF
jgi:hypothetical protein